MRGSYDGRGPRPHDEEGGPFGGHGGPGGHGRFGGHGPGGHGRPRGGRGKRGDIRTSLLAVLIEGPGHGYDIMQRIEEKTGGAWRPSPGSVYPTLQLLGDEGFVVASERDGKRVFEITETGRVEAQRRLDEAGGAPWELTDDSVGPGHIREGMGLLHLAAKQVAVAGTADQVQAAVAIIADARKKLYLLLSAD